MSLCPTFLLRVSFPSPLDCRAKGIRNSDNEIVKVKERGRIYTVTQSLLVKAEGTEKTDTYNWLLCPTGEALTEEVELQLPKNVVDGSDRISLSVLGKINHC
ncbi:alpha-2-macroglobulin-P-like [Salmo salar]|uniref:Alpha-2-macroglobulin-P-like n=1 Tax=Salmo salar TaxID=8030 RepID=A0A1S3SXX7_SALSA|nr:alpha-2-macroglobulin-P-like [Salmo salar]|eukprot:XP_014069193.1 PREDICTED: alpha-2-macroglobulin-P-like [Salmo salar]